MPRVNDDFNRTCTRLDLAEQRSGIFTSGEHVLGFNDEDLRCFNDCAARVAPGTPALEGRQIAGAARRLSRAVGAGHESHFIRTRMRRAGEIRALLADEAWACDEVLRERMRTLVAYMDSRPGLIPDDAPVIGGLDDALLVDLAMEGLRGELDEYADFCRYRVGEAARLGIAPALLMLDRASWSAEREEELRLERQLRRIRKTPYAAGGHVEMFKVS